MSAPGVYNLRLRLTYGEWIILAAAAFHAKQSEVAGSPFLPLLHKLTMACSHGSIPSIF